MGIISVYLDNDLIKQLKEEAKEKHLSLSTYIKIILFDRKKKDEEK